MARLLRVSLCLFSAAVGVAPPAVLPHPTRPSFSPVTVKTVVGQTPGTDVRNIAAAATSLDSKAKLAPRLRGQQSAVRNHASWKKPDDGLMMEPLRSPTYAAISEPHFLRQQISQAPKARATDWANSLGALLLAAVAASTAGLWYRRRSRLVQNKESATEMIELPMGCSCVDVCLCGDRKFAVAAFGSAADMRATATAGAAETVAASPAPDGAAVVAVLAARRVRRSATSKRLGGHVVRRALLGSPNQALRDTYLDPDLSLKRTWVEHEKGLRDGVAERMKLFKANRAHLSRVQNALLEIAPRSFSLAETGKLKSSKTVGTCVQDCRTKQFNSDLDFEERPEYVGPPKKDTWLEQDKGGMEVPTNPYEYKEWVSQRHRMAESAAAAGIQLGTHDIACERDTLLTILDFMDEHLTKYLCTNNYDKKRVDICKVTKVGNTLVMDQSWRPVDIRLGRPYKGEWARSERSNHGEYLTSAIRACSGDYTTRRVDITGRNRVAGKSKGQFHRYHRFIEHDLAGLKLLVRTNTHMQQVVKATEKGEKDKTYQVELKIKNRLYRQELTTLSLLWHILFGNVQKVCLVQHRSGKVGKVMEVTKKMLNKKTEGLGSAAARRLGRLAQFFKKVKVTLDEADGDGPWLLQWDATGRNVPKLVLGTYKEPLPKEEWEAQMKASKDSEQKTEAGEVVYA